MKKFSKKVTSQEGKDKRIHHFCQNPKEATMVVGSMPNSMEKL
jgi:hypothetical protein